MQHFDPMGSSSSTQQNRISYRCVTSNCNSRNGKVDLLFLTSHFLKLCVSGWFLFTNSSLLCDFISVQYFVYYVAKTGFHLSKTKRQLYMQCENLSSTNSAQKQSQLIAPDRFMKALREMRWNCSEGDYSRNAQCRYLM